ncbi:MAG TPA: F0F1 ATP synthase subunit alpha [Chloroflexi bacterium]|nr:F0F1 ATP synthase subunit alpha [Chloroflexota bacterium]
MSDQQPSSGISALLTKIQGELERLDDDLQIQKTAHIQRLSDRAAALVEAKRVTPDLDAVLQTLHQESSQMTAQVRFYDVGTVQHIGDGVATLSGLPSARTDELVTFSTDVQGLILNLDHARIDVVLLGSDAGIQGGSLVTATGQRVRVPVGHQLLGRVLNPLGVPLDDHGPIEATESDYLDREAPDIIERAPVDEPIHTGLKIVDALIPIGRGQRELILGDRQTGKTTLAVDAILNQRESDVVCVYVAIGQKKSSALAIIDTLRRRNVLKKCIVVLSGPDDPPALRYLAPYAGCTMAEFLMHAGRDVLIVYDDLSKHADAYRELSLLLRRPPGREAYPGDIFYLHARLLERACKLKPIRQENGEEINRSLTALPIIETQRGNVSAYIPTNLISICDGQIVLDADLFNRGIKPAVNIGKSVSRVGGEAQTDIMRELAGELKLELSQYEEVARFARFGAQVDEATRRQIRRGERLRAALTQAAHRPRSLAVQIVTLLAATEGVLDTIPANQVSNFEGYLIEEITSAHPELMQRINRTYELSAEDRKTLMDTIAHHHTNWLAEKEEQ